MPFGSKPPPPQPDNIRNARHAPPILEPVFEERLGTVHLSSVKGRDLRLFAALKRRYQAVKHLIAIEHITCDNGRVFKHDPGLPGVKEEISSSERKGCRQMV